MTHWIGPYVVLNNRLIQRCMVCGCKLVDSDEGSTNFLPVGAWYDDEDNTVFIPMQVPEENCLRFIE